MALSTMADYSFGGTDEENAELKKLNAEVVCSLIPFCSLVIYRRDILTDLHSSRIQTASRIGRSLSVPQKGWKVALIATQVHSLLSLPETYTTDSSPSFRCSLVIGRNMPTWSFR